MQNGPDGGELGGEAPIPRCGALLIRPLLMTSRAEIAAYCAEHRLAPAEDPSNSAPRYARARVRRMLPALAAENPRVVAALGRTARVCADDYDFIQSQLDAVWPALAAEVAGAITLRRGVWQEQHPALQRYAVRRAAERLGATELSLAQVEAVRATATHQGRALRLGRTLRVEVDHTGMHLVRAGSAWHADGPQLPGEALPLAVGATALGAGWSCVVSDEAPAAPGRWWTALDADALDGPLELRRRRPGDRFRPAGGPGSRKLQDFFVDRKVPRGSRDAWPILATPDAIVWVAGLRADARFIAGPATRRTRWVGFVRDNDAPTDG